MNFKKLLNSAIVVGMIAGFAGTANATMVLSDSKISVLQGLGYGIYLGTFNGNDNEIQSLTTIESQINSSIKYTGADVDLDLFGKVDAPAKTAVGMTVSYNSSKLAGGWTTTESIEFYTVKGSNNYSIWWMNDVNGNVGATSGNWTTEGIVNNGGNQPKISHLSTWNDNHATTNVPEPSILSLLGLSLLGVGFIRKRTK